jgi:hypothetical protein
MGMAGMDIANPAISGIISSLMYYGAIMLPKMSLNRTETQQATSGIPGAKRSKFYYGPLDLASKQVRFNSVSKDTNTHNFSRIR